MGAVLISFAPVMVKVLPYEAAEIAAFRTLVGGVFLLLLLGFFKTSDFLKNLRQTPAVVWMFLGGSVFALDMYLWNVSVLAVGAGLATVLANTQVFYMTAWGVLKKEESFDAIKFCSTIAGFVGLCLIGLDLESVEMRPKYLLGVTTGILAGLAYTGYMLCFRQTIRLHNRGVAPALCVISLVCGIWMLFLAMGKEGFVLSDFAKMNVKIWLQIIFLGVAVHVGGWFFISRALQKLPPSLVGLSLLAQPMLASLWGHAFFGERFTNQQLGGILLTLLGIGAIHIDRYRARTRRRTYGA
mgnify:CR=1 FL=1